MRHLITALAGVAALAVAAPAAAQYDRWDNRADARANLSFDDRVDRLEARIQAGLRSGEIDSRQGWALRRDLQTLRALERRYDNGGISRAEHDDLQRRLGDVRRQVRTADRGSWDRYERAGEWAEYDNDRFDDRNDRNDRNDRGYGYGSGDGYGRGEGYGRGGASVDTLLARLDARVEAGIRNRAIDRRQADGLRREIRQLDRLEDRYSRDGLSREEHEDLRRRVATLRQQVRIADRGWYDRYENRSEWAGYDDRYTDDRYARGGPEELAACESRDGIGGILGGLFGVGGCPGLQVGTRVTSDLYAVPYEYRDQFQDGRNVYYRSDGRAVYAIDARTRTVLQVYPIRR